MLKASFHFGLKEDFWKVRLRGKIFAAFQAQFTSPLYGFINVIYLVLSTRRLMHIQNEEFEKLQFQCFEVFSAWDEQYETLQGTLRDIAKKKREEPLKISWRVNPAHKLLQTRIDQMRKFRRQHEQLRTVISRVLRATEEESGAIGEIDQAYEVVKEVDCLDTTKAQLEIIHRFFRNRIFTA